MFFIEWIEVIAQAETASTALREFGFAVFVAVSMIGAAGWLGRKIVVWWIAEQEKKSDADQKRQDMLAEAQADSYRKHIEVADGVLKAIARLTEISESNARAVELIATTNETEVRVAKNTSIKASGIHRAVYQSLLVGADLCDDRPEIAARLRAIAEELLVSEPSP